MSKDKQEGEPDLLQVEKAAERIAPYVHKTPVFTSSSLDHLWQGQFFFKCENLQRVGAFKFRGAVNAVFSLSEEEAACGVATHSSGNFAQALALAARMRGVPAYIVMPETAPTVKREAVKGYGGQITFCKPTLAARETTLAEVTAATGARFLHPYDDYQVIAGQGTAALELCREISDLDTLMVPVGGGGLLAGTAVAAKGVKQEIDVVAAEPTGADDAYRSFAAGRIIPSVEPDTIADGLLTSLGERNFPIIQRLVSSIVTVEDQAIRAAMRVAWERLKLVIEPSAAVPLAALMCQRSMVPGHKIGVILSGGNVDLDPIFA